MHRDTRIVHAGYRKTGEPGPFLAGPQFSSTFTSPGDPSAARADLRALSQSHLDRLGRGAAAARRGRRRRVRLGDGGGLCRLRRHASARRRRGAAGGLLLHDPADGGGVARSDRRAGAAGADPRQRAARRARGRAAPLARDADQSDARRLRHPGARRGGAGARRAGRGRQHDRHAVPAAAARARAPRSSSPPTPRRCRATAI